MDISNHAMDRFVERVGYVDNPAEIIQCLFEQSRRLTQRQLLDRHIRIHPETKAEFWGVFYEERFVIFVTRVTSTPYVASVLVAPPKRVLRTKGEIRHCPNCGSENRRTNSKRYCRYCSYETLA